MQNPRNDCLLNEVISKCEILIDKSNCNCLHDLTFCPSHKLEGCINLLEIETLASPISPIFFTFVLNALGNLKEVFGYILKSSHHTLTLYVGLKTAEGMTTSLDILKNGLKSSYPNSKFRELSPKESSLILEELFNPSCYHTLSSAIVIPNNTSSSNAPINQKLVDLMGNEDFVALFLASAITRCEIKCLIDELKLLYTMLSSFSETNYSFSHSVSKNTAMHISSSLTENDSNTCVDINGTLYARNTSKYTLITPSLTTPLQNSRILNISIGFYQTSGNVNTNSQSTERAETKGCSDSKTNLHINSTTITNSDALSFTSQNKLVIDLLAKLDILIARLTLASSGPLFCFGAYFLSASSATSIRAAFTYSGLATDELLNMEDTCITTWEDYDDVFPKLVDEIRNFNHLSFAASPKNECVTTATLITSSELLNSFYFPYLDGPTLNL